MIRYKPLDTTSTPYSTSLLGVSTQFIERDNPIRQSRGAGSATSLIMIFVSAVIFVTMVAIFEVLKNAINNYYAEIALNDPDVNNTPEDILTTTTANRYGLISSFVFAVICVIIAIIVLYIFIKHQKSML